MSLRSNLIKLFRSPDGGLISFFFKDDSVCAVNCGGNKENMLYTVSSNALPSFSLSCYNGNPIIISQKTTGEIYISKNIGKNWAEKLFLNSSPSIKTSLNLNICSGSPYLIFNSPDCTGSLSSLCVSSLSVKPLRPPLTLDTILPFNGNPYLVFPINRSCLMLAYRTKSSPLVLREISLSPLKTGTALPVFNGNLNISDISLIISDNKIHICVVARFGRISRLIYICHDENGFGPAKTIYESAKIDSCIIFYSDKLLRILCLSGQAVFCTESSDFGVSFRHVYRLKKALRGKVVKAEYVASLPSEKSVYTEVFVYADNPSETVLISDIDPLFAYDKTVLKAAEADNSQNLSEALRIYKNKAAYYESCLNEANKRLGDMAKALSKRNEELYLLNSRWVSRFNSIRNSSVSNAPGTAIIPVPSQNLPPEELPP